MKSRNLLLALALPAVAFLASCGTDPDKPVPTATFQIGIGYVFEDVVLSIDSTVKFGVVGQSNDQKLKNLSISLSTNGGLAGIIKDTALSGSTVNFTYKYKVAGQVGDKQTLTFKLTDDNGESASLTLVISVAPILKSITKTQAQKVWNIQGTKEGAYDLNTGTTVIKTEPPITKDILDKTPSSAVFNATWGSGNGTKYAKASNENWINCASSTYLYNLWLQKGATAVPEIVLTAGDVYVVKTGQTGVVFNIYLIKIDLVAGNTVDNNDYIEFSYMKGD